MMVSRTKTTTASSPDAKKRPRGLRYRTSRTQTVASRTADARELIGPLEDGLHVSGVTGGQFSMIDLVEYVAGELGGADVRVSTWTTGVYDVTRTKSLMDSGVVRTARFLLDAEIFKRSPEYAGPMIEALGVEAFGCLKR